ncbi:diaminopimelate decarboxylase [Salinigranum rubrum]|uniref:Diaminopimelate decarboxylase n=1 Tax=Salinigranum rubrum TaxID=755307 RepID=A0A2I8VHN7_9EURY|nr:diaminopimelate decarboxylase [Salinigranum rubrum]AUV81446.1 diaminopimelate decarboxylase [Salinigranum rubrum]
MSTGTGEGETAPDGESESENPPVRRLSAWDAADLEELAATYETPLYVMDLGRVRENCRRLREAFPDADVRYAAKAHTGRAVFEAVRQEGLGIECASAGEVERAFAAGASGSEVQYTAVNPPDGDLDLVVQRWEDDPDLTVTVGARDTVERLRERGFDGRLCVRVNPGVGAGHHAKVTTGGHAKFGVPYSEAESVVLDARDDFDVVGIHAHAGSGISGDDLSAHREVVRRMGDLARAVEEETDLEFVDVGGGFGVPYREDEPALDLPAVAEATREALGDVDAQLAVEPGRYVVADAGVLLATVNTVKESEEYETVVGIDAGMTTLLRPAMYDAYHAIRNLSAGEDRNATSVTVAGPICETSDVLCEHRPLAAPARGDVLAVGNAGAYGYEMASTYNSRPRPAEVVLDPEPRLARRRESLAALTELEQ